MGASELKVQRFPSTGGLPGAATDLQPGKRWGSAKNQYGPRLGFW